MGLEIYDAVLTRTGRAFTARWSCRKGDYLVWLRRDPFAKLDNEAQILDLWSMPDGAFVTITNRWQDFPPWFDLHPLEVKNTLVKWMQERVDASDYPGEPIDGPNIWRAKGGDRIVWVGSPKVDQPHVDGVLGVLECGEAVAVLGDHPDGPLVFMEFEQSPSALELCRAAVEADRSLRQPRAFHAAEWQLG
jgi:hypothetical protein